jgi:formate hydrogenlyase subunit 3/multisubunit Na+/H+ antiporter MnhD subunit
MNQPVTLTASNLPALSFLVPIAASLLVVLAKRQSLRLWQALALLASTATAGIGFAMVDAVLDGAVLTGWNNELRVDALSALMVALIGAVSLSAVVYSLQYVTRPHLMSRVGADVVRRRLWVFHWLLLLFLGTMVWGCVTNNLIMLFVAVEATTLASGLLVAFYWDRRALEASYKYLILLTVGITFALFGCVLMYAGAAATGKLDGGEALLISGVRNVVHLMPVGTAAIAVACLVIGFGSKAGIAPFHPWLPDAHAEAPTPISVLLSGVMIKMAAYALARTVSVFFPTWPVITTFVVAVGAFTMLLGIVMAFAQDDLKRLLAYSSVSQMGYVVVGLGLGTYLGCYGGLFHLVNHALYKSLLFMCVGAIIFSTGLRRISELAGLGRKMPITSACFVLGALAIGGLPPFNGFMSKLTIYLALAKAEMWWAVAISLLTGLLTVVVLVRAAYVVFWGSRTGSGAAELRAREVPTTMWVPMTLLAAACVLLGVFPQVAYPLLNKAAVALTTLGG